MQMRSARSALLAGTAVAATVLTAACAGSGDEAETPVDRAPGAGGYTAGDYTAEGSYLTPGGREQLKVELSLAADGTITALTVTPEGVSPNSKIFQGKFASGISAVAVGKSIASLDVDKVAGSSLSSGGFNAALDDIATQAAG